MNGRSKLALPFPLFLLKKLEKNQVFENDVLLEMVIYKGKTMAFKKKASAGKYLSMYPQIRRVFVINYILSSLRSI